MADNLLKLVTGKWGVPHVTSHDDGERNQSVWNDTLIILPVGQLLAAEIRSSNRVDVLTGALIFQGRHATLSSTQEISIQSGTAGQKRSDLIIVRYTSDSNNIESIEFDVVKGTATSGTPTDPSYTEGDIQAGASLAEYPIYRVNIDGVNITSIDLMCEKASPMRRIEYGTSLPSTVGYADGSVFMLYEA